MNGDGRLFGFVKKLKLAIMYSFIALASPLLKKFSDSIRVSKCKTISIEIILRAHIWIKFIRVLLPHSF